MNMKARYEALASRVLVQAEDSVIPRIVAVAMKVDFGRPITAYLCYARLHGHCAVGLVFGDRIGRFANGNAIHTSNVLSKFMISGYTVIETLNSCYVICAWAHEKFGPRFLGATH
jgi:hypothetical protein